MRLLQESLVRNERCHLTDLPRSLPSHGVRPEDLSGRTTNTVVSRKATELGDKKCA
jgi:hypothetical protein